MAVKRKGKQQREHDKAKKPKVVVESEPEDDLESGAESISDDDEDLMATAQNSTFDDYEDDEAGEWEEQTDEDGDMEDQETNDLDREAAGGELEGLKETAELYKSNIFKLEIDEMLKEVGVNYDKHKRLLAALKDIKKTFEDIPAEKESLLVQYLKSMQKKGITVPIMQEQPPSDALYKFSMQKPSNVNVVGSYALRTIAKTKKAFNVDVAVEMPSSLFQEKDHVDNRYFYKRSCYLAGLALALKKSKKGYRMEFSSFNGDHHRPVLLIHPPGDKSEVDFSKTKCIIRIIPCIANNVFPIQRLAPSKCNLRKDDESSADKNSQSTPLYNAAILKDTVPVSSLAFLYQHAKSTPAVKEAVMLAKIWLYQRGLDASTSKGSGFSLFIFSMLMGYLLQDGVKGNKKLSTGYSSYQLMRGTMDFLANHDFSAEPVMIGTYDHPEFSAEVFRRHYDVVIVDPTGTVNLAAGMTLSGLAQVQYEAKLAMTYFNDSTDRFEALFLKKVDDYTLRFDNFAKINLSASETIQYSSVEKFDNPSYRQVFARRLGTVLKKGLTDRAELIAVQYDSDKSWNIDSVVPEESDCDISIGLILNSDRAARLVDQGPDAQQKEAAEEFRKFWGSKAELRRFKDGSILESVVWQTQGYENRTLIVRSIVRYLLQHHFGLDNSRMRYWAGQLYPYTHLAKAVPNQLYNRKLDINGFQPVMTAFNELAKTIRATDSNLPLLINNVYPADPTLRYANAILPYPIDFDNIAGYPSTARYIPAIDVIVQLEGSSKWPDDLAAFQNVKLAFYLKIAQELENSSIKSVVVDDVSETNPLAARGYLDVYFYGFVFRCHLHVSQESKLLQRIVDNKQSDKVKKELAQAALENHQYRFQHRQLHTFHIQAVCAKHPAFSTTMRLVKRWFGAHLLTSQVPEEVIELVCAHVFVEPHPWSAPVSAFTGFTRVLALLASWDWRKSPLIVDLEGELTSADRDVILKNFTQLRERNPNITQGAMVIATAKDKSGFRWSQSHPNKAVAARIQALAKAAVATLEQTISSGNETELKRMFVTSMADYHVVIQLKTSRCTRYYQSLRPQSEYFSSKKASELGDKAYAGFDPASQFVSELQNSYGDLLMVFHNTYGGDKIGLVWNPVLTGAKQWRVTFGCNSVPVDMSPEGRLKPAGGQQLSKLAVPNFNAILKEIERLGDGIIESITVQKS